MCIYSLFQYLCLHHKLKIIKPCSKAFTDAHGVLTCPDAPNAQANDGTTPTFGHRTYGLGICDNIHCAWNHSILPIGEYGDIKQSFEDDTEIEDSPDAREDRVGRWFSLLSADQQLDHFSTEYPIPEHELSQAGLVIRHFPCGPAEITWLETLRWQELNPLYLTPPMLQWCVANLVLPASVVDGRKSATITPRKPVFGPFKVKVTHRCPKARGICKVCGRNNGDQKLKESTLAYRQNTAMVTLLIKTCVEEGTAWDPNVELKWDDKKGEWRTMPTSSPVNIPDAPYPASSNPAFVPSMTQAVDTAAVFGGQHSYLADSNTNANGAFGLTGGGDWDGFVQDAALDNQSSAAFGDNSWHDPGFFDTDDLSTIAASGLDMDIDFSVDTGASFNAGLQDATLDGQPSATFGDNSWQDPGFFDTDDLSAIAQSGLDMDIDFSVDTGA
jgi:hypothetical protein